MFDGELIKYGAADSANPEVVEAIRTTPHPLNRNSAVGRAILSRAVVYISDVRQDSEYNLQALARTAGFRSAVAVPMLLEGKPIGVVGVAGAEPAMFSQRQIALLQTFADQAVIAIENVRLFNELEARTTQLTRVGRTNSRHWARSVTRSARPSISKRCCPRSYRARRSLRAWTADRSTSTTRTAASFICIRRTACPTSWCRRCARSRSRKARARWAGWPSPACPCKFATSRKSGATRAGFAKP